MQYSPEESASFLIYRAGRLLRYRAAQYLKDAGHPISPEQWGLLLQINDKGESALSDLVEPVIGDHPNVTRLVNGLISLGLVAKQSNPNDKRSHLVTITPEGDTLIEKILPNLIEQKEKFFSNLEEHELANLTQSLKELVSELE